MALQSVAGYSGSTRRIFHFRPAGGRDDADSECDDDADRDPHRGDIDEVRCHREAHDDDDEADDVCSE